MTKTPKTTLANFVRTPRYHEFTLDRGEVQAPLTAEIRVNLNVTELNAIPGPKSTMDELFAAIAPYIKSWSLTAINETTGKEEPLPPPSEVGGDVLHFLEAPEAVWIVGRVRNGWQTLRYANIDDSDDDKAQAA